MRRACLVLLAAGVVCLAGCGPAPWPPLTPGPVTITILTGTDTSSTSMYTQLVSWWNANETPRTGIHVVLDQITGGATQAHSEMLADAETGGSGDDIYNLDNEYVPEFAAAGYIRPLQGHLPTDGFLKQPLESAEAYGSLYAAPFTTDVGLLYYRTDLGITPGALLRLQQQHTLNAVIQLADSVRRGGQEMSDYVGQFASYEGLTVNLLEIIRGWNPAAFTQGGSIRDPGAVIDGLLQLAYALGNGQIPAAALSEQENQSYEDFAKGHAVFMRNWPIYYDQLKSANVTGTRQVAGNFNVTALPFPSVLGGQDLAISTSSQHPRAALQVIKYLTSPQAELCLFAVGGFPATRGSAYTTPKPTLPSTYGTVQGYHLLCGNQPSPETEIGSTIRTAIEQAILRPRTRYYTEFSTVLRQQAWQLLKTRQAVTRSWVNTLSADIQAAVSGRAPPS